ncbi:MAG: hypothetical protein Q8O61_18925 [Nocardioides sp.]|nr:hypothetical protein [Nocardioides sp.]
MESTQLRDELDKSFGDGPPSAPVTTHLEAGRRARRRRQTAAAALGTALVLGGGYAALAGTGSTERTSGDVASDPTSSPTPTPPQEVGWDLGPVRYRDGALEVHPDAVVHERTANPYEYTAPRASAALDVTFEGRRTWVIAELLKNDEVAYAERVPDTVAMSFAEWVADQAGLVTDPNGEWPDTLVLDDDGAVVASPGSEILQRTDDPALGDNFASPGEPQGAALVRAADGQSYFVVWRMNDGRLLDVITAPPADVVGATFQEMLSYARTQYANEVGLR